MKAFDSELDVPVRLYVIEDEWGTAGSVHLENRCTRKGIGGSNPSPLRHAV
jgi:hypothetical protein